MDDDCPKILGPEVLQSLGPITSACVFRKGATLFQQGRPSHGLYIIEQGQVRVVLCSDDKPVRSFELVGPGAVLGLSESVTGGQYKVTAEALEPTTASYIERQELMAFLSNNSEVCMQIVHLLSEDLHVLYHKFRTLKGTSPRGRRKGLRNVN